jgi:hypothetical protein
MSYWFLAIQFIYVIFATTIKSDVSFTYQRVIVFARFTMSKRLFSIKVLIPCANMRILLYFNMKLVFAIISIVCLFSTKPFAVRIISI